MSEFLSPVSNSFAVALTHWEPQEAPLFQDPTNGTGSGARDAIPKVTQESVGTADSYAWALDPWVCGILAMPHTYYLARVTT